MISLDAVAVEVFQILQSYDYTVLMYDEDGNQVYEPEETRRFFSKSANLLVSLVEKGDDNTIKLIKGKDISVGDVFGLTQALRTASTKYNMLFKVETRNKILKPADFSSKSSVSEQYTKETMDILKEMYGTQTSSYLKLENARLIVRHSRKIDENVLGSRARHIDRIYIENNQGERFRFPSNQLAPAQAMTNHVNHGGTFADVVGAQILQMADAYANLRSACEHIYRNSENLSESAQKVRSSCRKRMMEMRKCFRKLCRNGGYVNEARRLEENANAIIETELPANDDVAYKIKNELNVEGVVLPDAIIESIIEAIENDAEFDSEEVSGDGRTKEIKEPKCEKCDGKGTSFDGDCKSCGGSGVDSTIVGGIKVSRKAWDEIVSKHLQFHHRPTLNPTARDGKSEIQPKFSSESAKISFYLSQIAKECKTDSVGNFIAAMAEQLVNPLPTTKLQVIYKVALAVIHMSGLSLDEPSLKNEAILEYVEWFNSLSSRKVLSEREDYDDYNEHSPEAPFGNMDLEDAEQTAVDEVISNFEPQAFLDYLNNEVASIDDEGAEVNSKAYLKTQVGDYLRHQVEMDYGFEIDMQPSVDDVWPQVEDFLNQHGYELSEDVFSQSDAIVPTNQSDDLMREVEPPMIKDLHTGELVPVDNGVIQDIVSTGRNRARY